MAHEAHRRLGGTCKPGVGCIPVSILAEGEDSKARGNNCPQTDRLWDVVSRLSETVGRHDAALASKITHPKLAVVQANLVTIELCLTNLIARSQHDARLVAWAHTVRGHARASLDTLVEYRSA